jgi:iron complex outermembrane receptor protein
VRGLAPPAAAQVPTVQTDPVVVTATRVEQKSFDLPVSIDAMGQDEIQDQQLRVNISESLGRVPGLVANNRYNYAQDIQISIRGFGARASFGVRGVKLYQDGIPLTMPDGQGQTGSFALDTAKRIEVLRGPFAALYGNASGGVIQLFTQDGPPQPTLSGGFAFGSYDTWRANAQFGGQAGRLNYIADASRFMTDGYRDHSAASRNLANAKVTYALDGDSSLTLLATSLDQPNTQDPLGLTAQQVQQNPRQAGTGALQFNTRKSVGQTQGGAAYQRRLTREDTISAIAYGGHRDVTQYLAFTGVAPTSSGGVVDLDRDFYGGSLQWSRATELAGGPLTFTLGLDYSNMAETRQGFVNNFGVGRAAARRRDTVYAFISTGSVGLRAELAILRRRAPCERPVQGAGLFRDRRKSNDSGSISDGTSPVLGLLYKVTDTVNLCGAVGRGFGHRPSPSSRIGRTGNRASTSACARDQPRSEVNEAYISANARPTALFYVNTGDDIVNDQIQRAGTRSSSGEPIARASSSRSRRRSARVFRALAFTAIDGGSGPGVSGELLRQRIPGVPASSTFAELAWTCPARILDGDQRSLGVARLYRRRQHRIRRRLRCVQLANRLPAGGQGWRVAEFVQVNNLGRAVRRLGSSRGQQYFEPSPARNWLVGINASYAFWRAAGTPPAGTANSRSRRPPAGAGARRSASPSRAPVRRAPCGRDDTAPPSADVRADLGTS